MSVASRNCCGPPICKLHLKLHITCVMNQFNNLLVLQVMLNKSLYIIFIISGAGDNEVSDWSSHLNTNTDTHTHTHTHTHIYIHTLCITVCWQQSYLWRPGSSSGELCLSAQGGLVAQLAAGCCSKTPLKGSWHSHVFDVNRNKIQMFSAETFVFSLLTSLTLSLFSAYISPGRILLHIYIQDI